VAAAAGSSPGPSEKSGWRKEQPANDTEKTIEEAARTTGRKRMRRREGLPDAMRGIKEEALNRRRTIGLLHKNLVRLLEIPGILQYIAKLWTSYWRQPCNVTGQSKCNRLTPGVRE
jgi:hypothetical protein